MFLVRLVLDNFPKHDVDKKTLHRPPKFLLDNIYPYL